MSITVDSTTEPVNLIWYEGDNQSQTFRFLKATDEPWDLTGVFVRSQARSTLGKVTDLTVGIDDPASGVVTLHPPLGGLDPDLYDYDVQFNDGHATASWVHGRLQIRKDVTG